MKASDSRHWKLRDVSGDSFGNSDSLMDSHPDRWSAAEQEQEQNWAKEDQRGTGTARTIGVVIRRQSELPDLDIWAGWTGGTGCLMNTYRHSPCPNKYFLL